jgi:hypothetical protein
MRRAAAFGLGDMTHALQDFNAVSTWGEKDLAWTMACDHGLIFETVSLSTKPR